MSAARTSCRAVSGENTAVTAAAVALLLVGSVQVPGQRGALSLSEGFVPGLWQARFVVARRPAALVLPDQPLRATAWLSGPARLEVRLLRLSIPLLI